MQQCIASCGIAIQICTNCPILIFDDQEIQDTGSVYHQVKCEMQVHTVGIQHLNELLQ